MPENFESQIGFEATDALRDLTKLAKVLDAYSQALQDNVDAANKFNKANSFEEALEAQSKIVAGAAKNLEKLAAAEREAAKAQQEAAAAAKRAADNRKIGLNLDRLAASQRVRQNVLAETNITPEVDPRRVASLDKAIAQLQKLVQTGRATEAQIERVNKNLGASYQGAEREIRDALLGIQNAQQKLFDPKPAQGLQNQLANTLNAFIRYRIVAGIFEAISGQIRNAIDQARQLELRLAEIQTISPEFRIQGLDAVQTQVQNISANFGIDQLEVAAALYQSLSNQIGNAAQTTAFLTEAAEFSRATLTNLADSVDLLSGVLNAYNLEASNADRISNILFKTIELGRVRGEELANNFGNITSQAAQLGISVEEVGASLATITIQGVKADTAMTGLQNILIKLVRPSEGMKKALDELGVSSVRAGIQTFGLIGFLIELEKTTNGTIEELGDLFPRVRALRGELALMADEGNKATDTFEKFRTEINGVADEASEIVLETEAAKLEKNLKSIENAFTSAIGRPIIKLINELIEAFGGANQVASFLANTLKIIGPIAAASLGVVAVANVSRLIGFLTQGTIVARGFALALGALGVPGLLAAGVLGVGALIVAFNQAKDVAAELKDEIDEINKVAEESIKKANKLEQETIDTQRRQIEGNTKIILQSLRERSQAYEDVRDDAIEAQEAVTDSLKDQLDERLSLVNKLVNAVVKAQEKSKREIDKINQAQVDFEFEINQGRFERKVKATDDPRKQTQLLVQRSQELIRAAERAAAIGNTDFADKLIQESARIAERLADNTQTRQIGEQQINRVLNARKALNKTLIDQEKSKAAAAAAQEQAIKQQAQGLRRNIDDFNKQAKELQEGVADGQFSTADVEQRKKNLQELAKEIENQFQNIGQSGLDRLLGESQALRLLRDPFNDPTTGAPLELNLVIGDSVDRLLNTLQAELDKTPARVRVALELITGEELDIRGFTVQQDRVAQVSQEAQTAAENSKELTAAQQRLAASNQAVRKSNSALGESFGQLRPFITAFTSAEDAEKTRKSVQGIQSFVKSLQGDINEALASGDTKRLDEAEAKLKRLSSALKRGPESSVLTFEPQQQVISEALAQLDTLRKARQEEQAQRRAFLEGQNQAARLEAGAANVQGKSPLDQLFEDLLKVGNAGDTAGTKTATSFDAAATSQRNLREEIRQTNQLLREQEEQQGGPVQNRRYGGRISYFQEGGFAPRGTDRIPAMLSPDEFVVNPTSSRRFFSELVAINAGKPPVFRQDGGPVTQNNFTGDINLNVSAPNGVVNGREAVQQIRRELRRKSSKL